MRIRVCAASFPLKLGFFVKEGRCMEVILRMVRGLPKARATRGCGPLSMKNTIAIKNEERERNAPPLLEREREREREREIMLA